MITLRLLALISAVLIPSDWRDRRASRDCSVASEGRGARPLLCEQAFRKECCLLERLVRYAFEQLLSRPNGLEMQQFGGEMWREDRKINCMADDDDSHN